mgnify:CR=1 FL=1
MLETIVGKILSSSVVTGCVVMCLPNSGTHLRWACTSGMELHVDNNFEAIYESFWCKGYFNSCMTDMDRHSFYLDSVKAKAAYLKDEGRKNCSKGYPVHRSDRSGQQTVEAVGTPIYYRRGRDAEIHACQ